MPLLPSPRWKAAAMLALAACAPAPSPGAASPSPPLVVPALPRSPAGADVLHEGLRFGRVAPVVGMRWSVSTVAASALDVFDGQLTERQMSEYVSAYTVEVLAVDEHAPTKVRVIFVKNAQRYQGGESPTPIQGKTYDVAIEPPYVREPSGAPAPAAEAERVLDVYPDLGTRAQVDQILPDFAMRIGEERNDLAAAILRVLHPRAWTLDKGTAALARSDEESATFTIAIEASSRRGLRMDMKGEAAVRLRDARLVSVRLSGTYAPTTPGPSAPAQAPGTLTIDRVTRDL